MKILHRIIFFFCMRGFILDVYYISHANTGSKGGTEVNKRPKRKKQGVNEQKMVRKGINDCHLESGRTSETDLPPA